jgi:hypothetical protein
MMKLKKEKPIYPLKRRSAKAKQTDSDESKLPVDKGQLELPLAIPDPQGPHFGSAFLAALISLAAGSFTLTTSTNSGFAVQSVRRRCQRPNALSPFGQCRKMIVSACKCQRHASTPAPSGFKLTPLTPER